MHKERADGIVQQGKVCSEKANLGFKQHHRWIREALAGDTEALAWLLAELTPEVQNRAARALLRYRPRSQGRSIQQEVEDLTQDIFLWLFEKGGKVLKSWSSDQGVPLVGFIGFVAGRKAMDIMRIQKTCPWTEQPTIAEELEQRHHPDGDVRSYAPAAQNGKSLESQIASKQLLRLIVDKLNDSLSPLGRDLFCLMFIEHNSVQEVGDHLGMKVNTVHAWRSRLGRKLREIRNQIKAQDDRIGYRLTNLVAEDHPHGLACKAR